MYGYAKPDHHSRCFTTPTADINPSITELTCANTSATLDASGSTTQGAISYLWSTTETTSSISVATPGTYTLTITDADNGCTDTQSQTITQDALTPTADINPSITELTCANTSATLDAAGSTTQGAISYLWSTTETTSSISVATPGTYTLTITDADNGCTDTESVIITEIIDLTASAIATPISCFGLTDGRIDLTVNNGKAPFTFNWDSGQTTQNIVNLGLGTYNVTINDANGCTTTASAQILEPLQLTLSVSSTPVTCNGSSNGEIALTISGGTSTYNIDWDYNGLGDTNDPEDPTGLVANNYNVTVTDANGCTATIAETVTEPSALNVNNHSAEVCTTDAGNVNLDTYYADVTSETGTIVWYYDAARTNVVPGTPPVVTVNDGDIFYYEFTQTSSGCSAEGNVDFSVDNSFCILPVELVYFVGEEENCDIRLNWATQTEENASHFEIQKSIDGEIFEKISEIAAFGNTSNVRYYEFVDENVNTSENYYRLKQIDNDGVFEYSEVVHITVDCFEQGISEVNLYPNPIKNNDFINVTFNSVIDKEDLQVKVFDVLGRPVSIQIISVKSGRNAIEMNVGDLPSGNYFINIKDVSYKGITKPFIIIRD